MKISPRVIKALSALAKDRGIHFSADKVESTDGRILLQFASSNDLQEPITLTHSDMVEAVKRAKKAEIEVLRHAAGALLVTPGVKAAVGASEQEFPKTDVLFQNLKPVKTRFCLGLGVLESLVQALKALPDGAHQKDGSQIVFEVREPESAISVTLKSPEFTLTGLAMPMREVD